MGELKLKLAPQCRLMKICGVHMVGNPEARTLIGLNEDGFELIESLRVGKTVETLDLSKNEIVLLNELSANGFFTTSDNYSCVKGVSVKSTPGLCRGMESATISQNARFLP